MVKKFGATGMNVHKHSQKKVNQSIQQLGVFAAANLVFGSRNKKAPEGAFWRDSSRGGINSCRIVSASCAVYRG